MRNLTRLALRNDTFHFLYLRSFTCVSIAYAFSFARATGYSLHAVYYRDPRVVHLVHSAAIFFARAAPAFRAAPRRLLSVSAFTLCDWACRGIQPSSEIAIYERCACSFRVQYTRHSVPLRACPLFNVRLLAPPPLDDVLHSRQKGGKFLRKYNRRAHHRRVARILRGAKKKRTWRQNKEGGSTLFCLLYRTSFYIFSPARGGLITLLSPSHLSP